MPNDLKDVASKRQRYLLILAERAKERGITVAEVRDASLHHGRVSGALSALHKKGKLARLEEMRGRCRIYVLPEFVNDRPTQGHGVIHKSDKQTMNAADVVEGYLRRGQDENAMFDVEPDNPVLEEAMWRLIDYARGELDA